MDVEQKIRELAASYGEALRKKIAERTQEMLDDDKSHYLIYRALGISEQDGQLIDAYQNTGRFLYRYTGTFLQNATRLCFESYFPDAVTLKIPNTIGRLPKTFEIDCLIGEDAYEIKWRDATTDGDHITKEHTRIRVIADAGYRPIRLMYFYPNRVQARRVQAAIQDLYKANNGAYYAGDDAWSHIRERTNIDLLGILHRIVSEK